MISIILHILPNTRLEIQKRITIRIDRYFGSRRVQIHSTGFYDYENLKRPYFVFLKEARIL